MTELSRVLVFGIGNPARGDDALGVLLVERIRQAWPQVSVLEVFQLQVEHALDLSEAELVLFCDAALGLSQHCELAVLQSSASRLAFSHALPPSALLDVFQRVQGCAPPPAFVLAMRADQLGLGESLSPCGEQALEAAWQLAEKLFAEPELDRWLSLAGSI